MLGFPTVAIRLLLKSAPQPLKFPNLASKCIEVISCHTIGVHPRFLCITCNFEQLTDFVEGEAKLTAVPNESQTSDEGVVVFAKPIAGPGGSGQQSHLLVVANRFDTGAGESAQHAYGIGDGHDKSDSLPRASISPRVTLPAINNDNWLIVVALPDASLMHRRKGDNDST